MITVVDVITAPAGLNAIWGVKKMRPLEVELFFSGAL